MAVPILVLASLPQFDSSFAQKKKENNLTLLQYVALCTRRGIFVLGEAKTSNMPWAHGACISSLVSSAAGAWLVPWASPQDPILIAH